MSDDDKFVPKDTEKILDAIDNSTCGCTATMKGKMCQCTRNTKQFGAICESCKKHWHIWSN